MQLKTRMPHKTLTNAKVLVPDHYLHKCIIPLRDEPIPKYTKNFLEEELIRKFNHKSSVFQPWKPDTSKTIAKCVANDLLGMNIGKLIKTSEEHAKLA
jgi:hypothetical protein